MNIIVVSPSGGQIRRLTINLRSLWLWGPLALGVGALLFGAGAAGYALKGQGSALPAELVRNWSTEVESQRRLLGDTQARAAEDARALARRVAQLQAHVLRLEAAGSRLTELAGLEAGEFDFAVAPAMGGPEGAEDRGGDPSFMDVFQSLQAFERKLSDRERQLRVLEDLLVAGRVQSEVRPSGWPVETGWISSLFGYRNDPFSGRRAMHEGIDFAAREGTEIYVVGAGIVTFAGVRSGYGKLVEVNHGNGYVTRYSHNQVNLVSAGDRVHKGETVARVGSSGRSTGPHLHFEVLYNGRVVDPRRYIQAAR